MYEWLLVTSYILVVEAKIPHLTSSVGVSMKTLSFTMTLFQSACTAHTQLKSVYGPIGSHQALQIH